MELQFFYKLALAYISGGICVSVVFFIYEVKLYFENKKISSHFFITIPVFLSLVKIYTMLQLQRENLNYPLDYFGFITLHFLFAPAMYFHIRSMVSSTTPKIWILLFGISSPVLFLDYIFCNYPKFYLSSFGSVDVYLQILFFINVGLFIYSLKKTLEIINLAKLQFEENYILKVKEYCHLSIIVFITGSSALFFKSQFLFTITGLLLSTAGNIILFYLFRYPEFFYSDSYRLISTGAKYSKTNLPKDDLDSIKEKLAQLMQSKKLYKDEDLRLEDVALELSISKHQLSRILNEEFGKNFYQFINSYRIEEAKKLLVANPVLPIIDITYEIGFKSTSAFYKNFSDYEKMSPNEYRKINTSNS